MIVYCSYSSLGYKRTMGCSPPAAAAKGKAIPFSALFAPRLGGNPSSRSTGTTASTPGMQAMLLNDTRGGEDVTG